MPIIHCKPPSMLYDIISYNSWTTCLWMSDVFFFSICVFMLLLLSCHAPVNCRQGFGNPVPPLSPFHLLSPCSPLISNLHPSLSLTLQPLPALLPQAFRPFIQIPPLVCQNIYCRHLTFAFSELHFTPATFFFFFLLTSKPLVFIGSYPVAMGHQALSSHLEESLFYNELLHFFHLLLCVHIAQSLLAAPSSTVMLLGLVFSFIRHKQTKLKREKKNTLKISWIELLCSWETSANSRS